MLRADSSEEEEQQDVEERPVEPQRVLRADPAVSAFRPHQKQAVPVKTQEKPVQMQRVKRVKPADMPKYFRPIHPAPRAATPDPISSDVEGRQQETPTSLKAKKKTAVYKCEHAGCGREFPQRRQVFEHVRNDHLGQKYSCTFPGCTKQFKAVRGLREHVRQHTGQRRHTCAEPGCGYATDKLANFVSHNQKKHPQRDDTKAVCDVCGKEFPTAYHAKKHKESVDCQRTSQYRCPVCEAPTRSEWGQHRHMSQNHKDEYRRWLRNLPLDADDETLAQTIHAERMQQRRGQESRQALAEKLKARQEVWAQTLREGPAYASCPP